LAKKGPKNVKNPTFSNSTIFFYPSLRVFPQALGINMKFRESSSNAIKNFGAICNNKRLP